MSSATMQTIPQPSPSMAPHQSPVSPQTGRPYHQQRSQNRDATSSRSPSSRRPTARSGVNDASPLTVSTPPQPQFYLSNDSSPSGSNTTTPRNHALPPSVLASSNSPPPLPSPPTQQAASHSSHTELRGGPPLAPPPRSSSNQLNQQADSPTTPRTVERGASSRKSSRLADDGPTSSPRLPSSGEGRTRERKPVGSSPSEHERERVKDDTAAAAASAARARRRAHQSPRDDSLPHRSPSTRESRSRQSARAGSSPVGTPTESASRPEVSREGSAVLSRLVVTDPQVDIEREQARLAEMEPAAVAPDIPSAGGLGLVGSDGIDDAARAGTRSRQTYSDASSSRRKETKFGHYILGQTLGEGEFGKVKMGWKKEGGVQVAIKLIRRESLGSNPSRLPKIYREISILRGLSHPNIVRLHEMVETDHHIGIILEYASGGELFDHILNHRYLKDQAARRLFAQLISGVGYLHKRGIVHRDLKLENLLLDRNRNIIITDFGFANTFDPSDDLDDEIEYNLSNREFVKKMDLERVRETTGFRRGDLMQTSCGSPCYAAPELVVSDSLYTGRKVDVWSCGVILYAMLAGYLPFDDDPANPEGDNINLLYKYIVTTPLTFPEYVTPHARDLLRRILVPDPRKRADLFEVARHSWLSEYFHVVAFITSSTTATGEVTNTTVTSADRQDAPLLARSASVREPSKGHQSHVPQLGGLSQKHGNVDADAQAQPKSQRDAKRRTVQVEYVAPHSATTRGDPTSPIAESDLSPVSPEKAPRTRGSVGSPGQFEPTRPTTTTSQHAATRKPLPQDPPVSGEVRQNQAYRASAAQSRGQQRPQSSAQGMAPPARPARDANQRSVSDSTGAFGTAAAAGNHIARPTTGGSLASSASITSSMKLPQRGSYSRPGQPVAPTVAATNVQGKLAQPKSGKRYVISDPIPQTDSDLDPYGFGRPNTSAQAPRISQRAASAQEPQTRSHKRSNTVGGIGERIFGRPGSIFGRPVSQANPDRAPEKPQKSYPPTSMQGPLVVGPSRTSTESRRSSFGFGRKASSGQQEKPRRFSLLPASFSLKNFGGGVGSKESGPPPRTAESMLDQQDLAIRGKAKHPGMAFGRGLSHTESVETADSGPTRFDAFHEGNGVGDMQLQKRGVSASSQPRQYSGQQYTSQDKGPIARPVKHAEPGRYVDSALTTESESSLNAPQARAGQYPSGFNAYDQEDGRQQRWGRGPGVLQKGNRKFIDAYEHDETDRRFASGGHNGGSSGAARKVMDFFTRRRRARAADDR